MLSPNDVPLRSFLPLSLWFLAMVPTCAGLLMSSNVPEPAWALSGLLFIVGLSIFWQQIQLGNGKLVHPLHRYAQHLSTYVICVLDKNLCIQQCYGNTLGLFGLEHEQVIQGTLFNDFLGAYEGSLLDLFKTNEIAIPIRKADGNLLLGQINICQNEDGYLLIIRNVTEDITLQGELSERARELNTVFNTIGDPVFLIDLDGTIRNINEAATRIYESAEINELIYDVIRQTDEPNIEDPIQRCLSHFQPISTEQHLQRQNRTVQIHIYPILNAKNRIRQLLYMEHDITNERLMELEVRLQHQKLQDNYRRLRELDEAKTQWLNSVSHELRTPLTSIRSFSELLLTYDDTEPATRREFLEIIVKESERLSRLINDMLDLARIESGSMPWHPILTDLVVMAKETCTTLKSIADKREIYIEVRSNQIEVRIHTDPDRLQQVLVNLISNAIKFSPSGKPILVCIDADEEDVRIAVEDDGPGIAVEDRLRIFERFSQGTHSLTEKPQGTGLGLTISHHIIKFMGGQITVTDPINLGGARLVASIPRSVAEVYSQELDGGR